MTENLIIDGVDHAKFDLEWAKRGGLFVVKPKYMEINDETMRDYEFFYTFCAGKVICINDYEVIGLDDGSTYVGTIDSINNDGYLEVRMATPQECEDAGVEYIEPPYAELEDLRKSHAIALADAQLLGFYYCLCGYSIESLVESMDLSQDEWGRMKNGESSTVGILHKELIEAIDNVMRGEK